MDCINEETIKYTCCGISVLVSMTVGVLLILSINTLEATEYGLDYSWLSKTVFVFLNIIR